MKTVILALLAYSAAWVLNSLPLAAQDVRATTQDGRKVILKPR
jgi:hypothetical protein